jgi:hypothetical protein
MSRAASQDDAVAILDRDAFGLNQSKVMNVIDSKSLARDAGGKPASTFPHPALDHDEFGLNQSKLMDVIDSKSLARDAGGKPASTFPHPALEDRPRLRTIEARAEGPPRSGRSGCAKALEA